jgi:PAS domain S-box-containing protein
MFLSAFIVLSPAVLAQNTIEANPSVKENISMFEIILLILLLISIALFLFLISRKKVRNSENLAGSAEIAVSENSLLYVLIDNMPDRIYIKDRKSRFIAANKFVARIMGVNSPADLINKTDFNFYNKDLAEEYFRDEQEFMKTGKSMINKEERGLDVNGKEVIVSTTKVPIKNEKGEVTGIVGIGRDISLQKINESKLIVQQENLQEANTLLEERQEEIQQQSEELHAQTEYLTQLNLELEKLSLVAKSTDNVILIMDADGYFEWGNSGFEKQMGVSIEEFKKTKIVNLREISSNKNINKILDNIAETKKAVTYDSKGIDRAGREFWSQTTVSPVFNDSNEIVKLIAIDSDITKLKNAEQEINLQKDEIEKKSEDLKKLNATKDKFFSIIAHDLKNPFHSIMGFSELLTRSYDSIDDERKKEFLQLIKDSSSSAFNLLENLLDWSRTQTNSIKFTPDNINLSHILHENIQMHSVIAQNKEIEIIQNVPGNIICFADANMINTTVRNLTTNALKFTPKGGKISVSAEIQNDLVKVSIKDSGIGMNKNTKDKLFKIDEFHNSVGTSGESGTGLGLIICNEFISRHSGTINVETEAGKGSTFSFSLPLSLK